MAAAQAVVKGSVVSTYGNRAAPGLLGRRRATARMATSAASAVRISGSWRKIPFLGGRLAVGPRRSRPASRSLVASPVQMNFAIGKAMRWWEKGLQPNMREIESAEDLVDSLTNAGDRLVIVDFFSPGCGGCRALHPKICQFAEQNPDVLFLQVNYEEHKSMCYSLHVHVLPFFRFYRGAQGRLCSFSCTNATIKKFKDALAKHKPDRCSLGPTRGLEESELLALAANKDLQFTYTKKPELVPSGDAAAEVIAPEPPKLPPATKPLVKQGSQERSLISSGR
ncbi:thioredoxin-like 1-2, chloroplastic [Phragmites australis]|uniref:thioredoxin-like 1-2, chloroplastic n=1 Tax=Phragmites australis TaxID=29695 RepID=UPI002D766C5D|nr:thioredoxin-like 1-2, chloroplastic [Phragmites australis]